MGGVILLSGIIMFSTMAHGAVELWASAVVQASIILWAASQAMGMVRRGKFEWIRTPADLPAVIFLGLIGVSGFISVCPYVSRIQGFRLLTLLLLFYGVINAIRTRRQLLTLASSISVFAVCYASAGMIVSGGSLFGIPVFSSGKYNISLTFPNHSHFAGFLELSIWLCLSLAMIHHGAKRAIFVCLSVYMAAAIAFSLSRGGFLGFTGGLLFFTAAMAFPRYSRRRVPIIAAFIILTAVLMIWLGTKPFIDRLETLLDPLNADPSRIIVWRQTLKIIADHPIFGTGAGTFPSVFPQYQPDSISHAYANHAHNDYLEFASEMGISGLICVLIGLFWLIIFCFKQFFSVSERSYHAVGAGALSGCFSLLIHAFFDFNFQIPSNAVLFMICIGLAVVSARLANPAVDSVYQIVIRKQRSAGAYAAVMAAASVGIAASFSPALGAYYVRQSQMDQNKKLYLPAMKFLNKAALVDPGNAETLAAMGDLTVVLFKNGQENTIDPAIHLYDRAIKNCSVKSSFYSKIGAALILSNRLDDAEQAYQKAVLYDPSNAQVHRDLGNYYLDQKKLDMAYPFLRKCILKDNKFLTLALNDLWEAEADYEQMQQVVPDNADIRKQFAVYLLSKGYRRAGSSELARMFTLDPTPARAADHLQQLIRFKEFDLALEAAETYSGIFSMDRLLKKKLADLYLHGENTEKALAVYQELIASNSKDPEPYLKTANIYFRIKEYDKGMAVLSQGIVHNPKHADFYSAVSVLCGSAQHSSQAAAMLQKGLDHIPASPAVYLALASCYRQMQQPDKSIEALKTLAALHHSNPYYLFLLGEEYRRTGLYYEAAEQWKQCLSIRPGYDLCQKALDSMYKKLGIFTQP